MTAIIPLKYYFQTLFHISTTQVPHAWMSRNFPFYISADLFCFSSQLNVFGHEEKSSTACGKKLMSSARI